jgi:hypothetical protein
VDELRAREVYESGAPLAAAGRVLAMVDGEIVDGPFTEVKEVLTGFFIVRASSLQEATDLARGCPALLHGETVLVKEIDTH